MSIVCHDLSRSGGRKVNEDAFGQLVSGPDSGCWVVADGLGGHGGGDVASRLVVESILREYQVQQDFSPVGVASLLEAAQRGLLSAQQGETRLSSMRSTATILLLRGEGALWAHIGDTRLYHFSRGRIAHQTKDHSVPQLMVDTGSISPADIRHHIDRNRLLRSLGNEDKFRPSVPEEAITLECGDGFLLCTDGFWEYVTETEMEVALAKASDPGQWLEYMELILLRRATVGHDNYTATAIFLE